MCTRLLGRCRPNSILLSVLILAAVVVTAVSVAGAATDDQAFVTGAPKGWKPPSVEPAVAAADQTLVVDPAALDQAIWKDGELLAPLPKDPERRAEAIEQARQLAAGRPMASAGVPIPGATPASSFGVAGSRSTEDPILPIEPYIPPDVRGGERSFNLKLPDTFVADPALIRGIDPATGKSLPQAQQDQALSAAFAPGLSQTFDGISQTSLNPPDCDVSAGPNHVIAVVNARWAIYDKCGNNLYEENIATFVGNGTDFFFDPKVIYDVWDNRWIITCCVRNTPNQDGWVLLMVSDDSDPIGNWCFWYVDYTWTGFWLDYQDVGTDPDGIYITGNIFDWSSPAIFQYAVITALDKVGPLTCGGLCGQHHFPGTNPGDGSAAFTLRPCDMNTWPGDYWLINSISYGGTRLSLWKMTDTGACTWSLLSYNLDVAVYDDPPPMLQPNGFYVDCGDARLLNASYAFGNIWAGHARRVNWGEPSDRSAIGVYQVQPYALTLSFQTGFGASALYYCYPNVDFDDGFNGIVCFARGGPGENPGSRYVDLANGGPWGGSNLLAAGAASYTGSINAGTFADPERWGDYYGCDRDPWDNKTLWFYGQYTVNATNWDTQVGAAAPNGAGVLSVTPASGLVSGGFQGGPFSPNNIVYTLSNTGGSALTWNLLGLASWESASATTGQIYQGLSQNVTISINANANAFVPGTYVDSYTFDNCYLGAGTARSTNLHVGVDGSCPGAKMVLTPSIPPPNYGADFSTNERGVYITAIKDFAVCAVGYKLDLTSNLPWTLEARIYEASGTTRGALLASGTVAAGQTGNVVHFVPVSATLVACRDYELVVVVPGGAAWEWWDENALAEPFDVGGAIRVRDGDLGGGAGNFALPHFEVIGSVPSPDIVTDLGGPGSPPIFAGDDNQDRGIYVRMLETAQLCSFGWSADLVAGQTITARVYEATGTTRGALIAEGTLDVASSGSQWHDVPINVQLLEGEEYDLNIQFGTTNGWYWWDENVITEPFTRAAFEVVNAEEAGFAGNFALPHYRAGWEEKTGGAPFDLKKITDVFPPPNSTSQDFGQYGAYVTSEIDQQVYGVGWMADIPAGQAITATVYEATGTTRGAVISQGTVYSSGAGMRWHDVPVAVEMAAGTNYDISFYIPTTNEWRWWSDFSGMPYTINGVVTVVNSEESGDASNSALIHMRMCACDAVLTPVSDDKPQRTPMFLAVPAPNPVSGRSRLDFALEEAGPVTLTVYDVAGRRVATILNDADRPKGWNTIDLDSRDMASGVYFLKLQTKFKSLSRKFVVTH